MGERILRSCLYAYPPVSRHRDGKAILDLATELASEGRWAFVREAAGLLRGGLGARAKLVWSDFTGAPWRLALVRLALPLAVAVLCLFVGYVGGASSLGHWMGWWALLGLISGTVAVWGAAIGRRSITVIAAALVLGLLALDAFMGLNTGDSRWWGNVYVGELNVLAMWLPVALLLFICSWAVGRTGLHRSRMAKWWIIGAPVVISGAGCSLVWRTIPQDWLYPNPLGGVYVWVPLVAVLATIALAVIRRDAALKTMAGILILTAVLPFMWVLAMVIGDPPGPDQYVLLTYWLPGIVTALVVTLILLRRRESRPERHPGP